MECPHTNPDTLAAPDLDAVVFDFDGTLACLTIDFGAMREAVSTRLAEAGLGAYVRSDRHILEMIQDACASLPAGSSSLLRAACAAEVEQIEVEAARSASLGEGVREALAALRRAGLRLGVITRNCRAAVLISGPDLLDHVDALVAREDTPSVKPDPVHVRTCLERIGAPDGRVAIVGDHPMDMVTAGAGGWRGFGVLSGAGDAEALREAGAEEVFADVPEFAAALLASKGRR